MPVMYLTELAVKRLRPPAEGKVDYTDDKTKGGTKGFGVRVNAGGSKSYFVFCYPRGQQIQFTIGPVEDIGLADARDNAGKIRSDARLYGIDPRDARKAKAVADEAQKAQQRANAYTVAKMVAEYIPWSRSTHKPKTASQNGYLLRQMLREADFADEPAASITTPMVKAYRYGVGPDDAEGQRCRIIEATGRVYDWALERDKVPSNPVAGIRTGHKAKARERVLSDPELKAFWIESGKLGYPWGPMFQLLALLGQRLSETAEMTWSELELGTLVPSVWTIPAERSKNHKAHRVPLPPLAVAILKGLPRWHGCDYCFSTNAKGPVIGISYMKRKIEEAIGCDDWVLHDCRRSFATAMQKLGVRLEVTESLLNHISGSRSGVVGIYQRYDWAAEKIEAMDKWADYLGRLVEG